MRFLRFLSRLWRVTPPAKADRYGIEEARYWKPPPEDAPAPWLRPRAGWIDGRGAARPRPGPNHHETF